MHISKPESLLNEAKSKLTSKFNENVNGQMKKEWMERQKLYSVFTLLNTPI